MREPSPECPRISFIGFKNAFNYASELEAQVDVEIDLLGEIAPAN